jgi:hypothetical protein
LFGQHLDFCIGLRVEKLGLASANYLVKHVKIIRFTAARYQVALVRFSSLQAVFIGIDSDEVEVFIA